MPTEHATRRELRLLRAYTLASTFMLGIIALTAFRRAGERVRFDEIDVQRINVVERDGRVRLVIANRERSPGPVYTGTPFGYPGGTRAGVIFYDDEGTEDGGLIFSGRRDSTGRVQAYGHLSFDQYGQDQVINLEYEEEGGQRQQGLTIADRPDVPIVDVIHRQDSIRRLPAGPAKEAAWREWAAWQGGSAYGAARVFVGRDPRKAAVLDLKDRYGRSRLRLAVDSLGAARVEFLDDSGRVTLRLPSAGSRSGGPPGR